MGELSPDKLRSGEPRVQASTGSEQTCCQCGWGLSVLRRHLHFPAHIQLKIILNILTSLGQKRTRSPVGSRVPRHTPSPLLPTVAPSTHSWPGLSLRLAHSPSHTPSLTFPLHSCMADLPPAPSWSLLLPQGGSYSPTSPLCQGWQTLQLQQPRTLPCPCQRKQEIRTGHGRMGSWDTGDITGSAVPLVLPATRGCLHLAPAFPRTPHCQVSCTELLLASSAQTWPMLAAWHICPTPSPHCSALPVCRKE